MDRFLDELDHRVIFVAACSSFITLFVLSLFNKFHYIKIHDAYAEHIKKTKPAEVITETDEEPISVSESSVSLLCRDMITDAFYIHQKTKNYFESNRYLNLIPADPTWVSRKIRLLVNDPTNYSEHLHQLMLDNFDPLSFEPKSNMYIKEIINGIKLFNQWRKWPVADGVKGWKYRTTTKESTKVYTHTVPDSPLDIVKAEQIFPCSVGMVIGVLMNEYHFKKMDPSIKNLNLIQSPSLTSHIIHLVVKTPPFIGDRDFLNVGSIFIFKDGSVLIANTKCNDQSIVATPKGHTRGEITLSIYHIRPDYDGNIQHTKVTFYSHVDIKGSIPSWILNSAYMETAKSVPNLEKFIKSLFQKRIIHKPGQLWIPPNPFLKMMNINIGDVEMKDNEEMKYEMKTDPMIDNI